MHWACIGIGANQGDRKKNLLLAIKKMTRECEIINYSSLYETPPYGYTEQNYFLNAALKIKTSLTPEELLQFLLHIESEMGRKRVHKWGPRNIDLDIIFYENRILNKNDLRIPHPDYKNRDFVLIPLMEIIPDFVPPDDDRAIKELALPLKDRSKIKLVEKKWITL